MKHSINKRTLVCGLAASAAVAGLLAIAGPGSAGIMEPTAPPEVYALTNSDVLLQFAGNEPNAVERTPIEGLRGNESLVGIDFRPTSQSSDPETEGALYGVGNKSNIYIIDEDSGEAEKVAKLSRANADGSIINPANRLPLRGNNFGVDFNPTVDRLRIVSDADQNLRVNVDTGGAIVDGNLAYVDGDENEGANPGITAVGYTNNQPGAFNPPGVPAVNSTRLFDLDTSLDILAQQTNANAGELTTIGDLGTNVKMITGFDIVTDTDDEAFASLQMKSVKASGFFSVDLESGDVSSMGRIDGPKTKVEGLAIPIGGAISTP